MTHILLPENKADVPITDAPTEPQSPTEYPTISPAPTGFIGRPPTTVVGDILVTIDDPKTITRLGEMCLVSEHPSGEIWPSYLYTWRGFQTALNKMTSGIGPGEKNFFYVGDGVSAKSVEYGLVNIAAFLAHAVTQSIYYDACDENSWEMVDFRYPLSNSCGQQGLSYQDEVCERDEDKGMECEVDLDMEIHGVTYARWVGAPPPMYCGNRQVGYWDHRTGLEENEPPFKNKAGRSDVKGCCWWGRGGELIGAIFYLLSRKYGSSLIRPFFALREVLQVRGVCNYGKLNYWLGAKAAAEKRESLYPDIDFCKNPGAICSDRRAPELRWVTGMFHWVQTIQRSRGSPNYFPSLKAYVEGGDYADDSFIAIVNSMLGGTPDDISKRSDAFFNALRAFGLISVEGDYTNAPVLTFCGVDFYDAGTKCTPCETNMDCSGMELCHNNVTACDIVVDDDNSTLAGSGDSTNATATIAPGVEDELANATVANENDSVAISDNAVADTSTIVAESLNTTNTGAIEAPITPMSLPISSSTNFCGTTWGDALTMCAKRCESYMGTLHVSSNSQRDRRLKLLFFFVPYLIRSFR